MAAPPFSSGVCVPALPPLGFWPMTVLHPGNPDEQRESEREREMGQRERKREAEGKRERERENKTDGMMAELL